MSSAPRPREDIPLETPFGEVQPGHHANVVAHGWGYGRGHAAAMLVWTGIGTIGVWLDSRASHQSAQLWMSTSALAFGGWAFWIHGRNQVTAAGLYSLASAMFVGFAGLWWWNQDSPVIADTFMATTLGFSVNLAMYALCWRPHSCGVVSNKSADPAVTSWGLRWGSVFTACGLLANFTGLGGANPLVPEAVFVGLSLAMVSISFHRSLNPRPLRALFTGAGALAIYYGTTFSGYGRLILVSLVLVPVVGISGQLARRRVKAVVLMAIVPCVIILSTVREQFGIQRYGTPLSGLGSLVEPLRDFGRLVAAHDAGTFSFAHGETFWATLVVVVPRAWWAGKPIGFGAELTQIFAPQLAKVDQSYAALNQAEWYFNFGWVGVAVMVPLIGLAIRACDRLLERLRKRDIVSRRDLLVLVSAYLIVADVPNLQWVGSFGYISRTGLRLMVLLMLLPLATNPSRASTGGPQGIHGG